MRLSGPLLILLVSRAALAQSVDVDSLVREGVDLRRQRRDDEALEVFQRAWTVSHSPRERAQMGFAEQALGHWINAEIYLREARAATGHPWIAERARVIDEALGEVEGHLGDLAVEGGVPGAEVRVEGRPVGTLPLARPLRVPAGTLSLEVTAAHHLPVRRDVTVPPRRLTRESVVLVPVTSDAPPTDPAATRRTLAWVAVGGAALGLGVGITALVARDHSATRWNSNACLTGAQTREANCADDLAEAHRAEVVSAIGFVFGGALALTSAALFVTLPPRGFVRPRARFGCGVGPGDLGVTCGGPM